MVYENGWGKKISSVWNTRGDSDIWSVTNRYTLTCNYTATVLDDSGMPVDGALVRVSTENYYNPDLLSTTTWGSTDYTGTVTIPLGDERNYWSSSESETLGSDPVNGVTQVISGSEAGANYSHTFNLPMSAEPFRGTEGTPPSAEDSKFRMEIDYQVEANIVSVKNAFSEDLWGESEHGDFYGPSGNVDFFIADFFNYNQYVGDLSFSGHNISEKSSSGDASFILPPDLRYYAVMSNEFSQATTMIVNITANIISEIEVEITIPQTGSEFNLDDFVYISGITWGPEGVDDVKIAVDFSGNWVQAVDTSGSQDPYSSWEFDLNTQGLTPGLHTVLAKASYGDFSATAWINIDLIDVTNPEVTMENPVNDAGFRIGTSITINGTVTDNAGIQSLELIIDSDEINATDITQYMTDGFFSYELSTYDLDQGEHTIGVKVYDSSGNSASSSRTIRILETEDPNVTIYSPSTGSLHKLGETMEISGFATDNVEISSLEITIDGKAPKSIISSLKEDGSWTYLWYTSSSSYTDGWHTILAKATDTSDNEHTHSIKVLLDGKSPQVTIDIPEDYQVFKAEDTITFEGIATDENGLENVLFKFDDSAQIDISNRVRNGEWNYDFWETKYLESGEHTVVVTVKDKVGHESQASITVIIDEEEPILDIYGQENREAVVGEMITMKGTVSDDLEVAKIVLIIDYDEEIDITHTLENGNWEYEWDTYQMSEGIHTVSIVVTDGVGNQVSSEVTYDFAEGEDLPDESTDSSSNDNEFFGFSIEFTLILIVFAVLGILILAVVSAYARKKN
jgi:hypothetical protein